MTIAYHAELRAKIIMPVPMARYDPARGLPGTQIWHKTFTLPEGSYLFSTYGNTIIRHAARARPGDGWKDYAMAANTRVALFSAADVASLPAVGTPPPEHIILSLRGKNISSGTDHYADLSADSQRTLNVGPAGWAFRVELWGQTDSDAWDTDGLGELGPYNCGNTHQFNIKVETL